MKKDSHKIKL